MGVQPTALLALLAAGAHGGEQSDYSLLDAFRAFADCEAEPARELLADRLSFFHAAPSEQQVRELPEHVARNEQEQVLRLQRMVLRPGLFVRLLHLDQPPPELVGCEEGQLLGCLQDGSFVCVVELWCGGAWQSEGRPVGMRVSVRYLRPAGDCGLIAGPVCTPTSAVGAEGGGGGRNQSSLADLSPGDDIPLPVSDEAVGQLIVTAVRTIGELEAVGELPQDLMDLGMTYFPDLCATPLCEL